VVYGHDGLIHLGGIMPSLSEYYSCLGVNENATQEEIKKPTIKRSCIAIRIKCLAKKKNLGEFMKLMKFK
jgi:hypothetical protein